MAQYMINEKMLMRILIASIITLMLLNSFGVDPVSATEVYNEENVLVGAYTTLAIDVVLEEDEGIGGWLRITNGDGIIFFIVDTVGYNQIQADGTAETYHALHDYAGADAEWYYWNFEATHDDTWYIYFSNAFWTAHAGVEDQLDIIIRTNTEVPSFDSASVASQTNEVVIVNFNAVDDVYPIDRVVLYANELPVSTIHNPNKESGVRFEGSIQWNILSEENGNYTLSLIAFDTQDQQSDSYHVDVIEVVHVEFDWFPIIVGAAIVVIIGIGVCFCQKEDAQ